MIRAQVVGIDIVPNSTRPYFKGPFFCNLVKRSFGLLLGMTFRVRSYEKVKTMTNFSQIIEANNLFSFKNKRLV